MEFEKIVTDVVQPLSVYLTRLNDGLPVDDLDSSANLWQIIRQHLQSTRTGSRLLDDLAQSPMSQGYRDAFADLIADELRRNSAFTTDLDRVLKNELPAYPSSASGSAIATGNISLSSSQLDNRGGVMATSGAKVNQSRRTRIGTGGLITTIAAAVVGLSVTFVVINDGKLPGTADPRKDIVGKWTAFPDVCALGIKQMEFFDDGKTVSVNGRASTFSFVDDAHINVAGTVLSVEVDSDSLSIEGQGHACTLQAVREVSGGMFGTWAFNGACEVVTYRSGLDETVFRWKAGDTWTLNEDGTMQITGKNGSPDVSVGG